MATVVPKTTALQYDGTNSAALLALVQAPLFPESPPDFVWTIEDESGGSVTLQCFSTFMESVRKTIVFENTDWLVVNCQSPYQDAFKFTDTEFSTWWTVVS